MKKYSFVKMSGAGNDFIIIDKNSNPSIKLNNDTVQKICNRRKGIGADGLIIISDSPDYDFMMNYYNSDGSTGSLCGNGARCSLKYVRLFKGKESGKLKFLSNDVVYSGIVSDTDDVVFNLNEPEELKLNFKINIGSKEYNASFINTGSPHVVINIEETDFKNMTSVPVVSIGRNIRYLDEFAPGGANVNFIKIEEKRVLIRTYERGVEDETLACGTGSAASAVISFLNYGVKPPVKMFTHGGDVLEVNFISEGHKIKALSLKGPAKVVYAGSFTEELIF